MQPEKEVPAARVASAAASCPLQLQVELLKALGIDTTRVTRVAILMRPNTLPQVRVSRALVVDGALVERVERLGLTAKAISAASEGRCGSLPSASRGAAKS